MSDKFRVITVAKNRIGTVSVFSNPDMSLSEGGM
jgi:hypothetical protein